MSLPFLSPEWIEAAREIRERYSADTAPIEVAVKVNQVITEVPFGDGELHAHIDTSNGDLDLELGHLDDPDARRGGGGRAADRGHHQERQQDGADALISHFFIARALCVYLFCSPYCV